MNTRKKIDSFVNEIKADEFFGASMIEAFEQL